MSLAEQERALFDLLFDQPLRQRFTSESSAALTCYQLTPDELADFNSIRADGLALDATLRAEQILLHFCRQLPVSFSLVSAINGGPSLLQQLINPKIMRSHPDQRVSQFGAELHTELAKSEFSPELRSAPLLELATTVIDVELAMVWTSATLKQQLLNSDRATAAKDDSATISLNSPVKLTSYVTAALLPLPYSVLKPALCPVDDSRLWQRLLQHPTAIETVTGLLEKTSPTLFLSRAEPARVSRCEARVNHRTVELNDGFAALLQQLDGSNSVEQILQQLQQVGATDAVIKSVRAGFQKMLESGMIETV